MIEPLEFKDFLNTQATTISLFDFVGNFVLASIAALLLRKIYLKFSMSLSNKDKFSRIFVLLTTTTMLIITIVKSSLALSLGLVGALSIVRFRSAIKEPEELSYLFLCIALGLGFGANQTLLTVIGFGLMVLLIIVTTRKSESIQENMILTIHHSGECIPSISDIISILMPYTQGVKVCRLTESQGNFEASLLLKFDSILHLEKGLTHLKTSYETVKFTLFEQQGLG